MLRTVCRVSVAGYLKRKMDIFPFSSVEFRLFSSSSSFQHPPPTSNERSETAESGAEESGMEEEEDNFRNKNTGELGGPKGPEPTRFGDWERKGRCYDF